MSRPVLVRVCRRIVGVALEVVLSTLVVVHVFDHAKGHRQRRRSNTCLGQVLLEPDVDIAEAV